MSQSTGGAWHHKESTSRNKINSKRSTFLTDYQTLIKKSLQMRMKNPSNHFYFFLEWGSVDSIPLHWNVTKTHERRRQVVVKPESQAAKTSSVLLKGLCHQEDKDSVIESSRHQHFFNHDQTITLKILDVDFDFTVNTCLGMTNAWWLNQSSVLWSLLRKTTRPDSWGTCFMVYNWPGGVLHYSILRCRRLVLLCNLVEKL